MGGSEKRTTDPFEGVEYFDGPLSGECGYSDYPGSGDAGDSGRLVLDDAPLDNGCGLIDRAMTDQRRRPGGPADDQARPDAEPSAQPALPRPLVPTAARLLDLVDFYVTEFAERPGVSLNLPSATEACAHLLRQVHVMALTVMKRAWEHEWTDESEDAKRWQDPYDLIAEFGPHLESVLRDHADLILTQWYCSR